MSGNLDGDIEDRRQLPNRRAVHCHVCGAEAPTGTCAYCRKAEYGE